MYHDYNSILILSRIYTLAYPSKEYTYNKCNTYLYPGKEYKILSFLPKQGIKKANTLSKQHIIIKNHSIIAAGKIGNHQDINKWVF